MTILDPAAASAPVPEAPPMQAPPAAAPAPQAPAPSISIPENWKEILDESIRGEASLQTVNSVQDLAKSFVNAQKMIGADKVQLPNKYDDGTQLRNVLNKLGLSEKLEEYDIAPKDIPIDENNKDYFDKFKQQAHKLGILPAQAKEMFKFMHTESLEQDNAIVKQIEVEQQEAINTLQKEWGAAFESKVNLAKQATKFLAGSDDVLYSTLTSPQYGNNPAIVKVLAKFGEMMAEDKIITGVPKDDMAKSPGEAQKEIQTIYGDKTHPYNNKDHPRHQAAIKEMQQLFQLMG